MRQSRSNKNTIRKSSTKKTATTNKQRGTKYEYGEDLDVNNSRVRNSNHESKRGCSSSKRSSSRKQSSRK